MIPYILSYDVATHQYSDVSVILTSFCYNFVQLKDGAKTINRVGLIIHTVVQISLVVNSIQNIASEK